jgi:5-formyltetrahydrofolate cyclo-ligase
MTRPPFDAHLEAQPPAESSADCDDKAALRRHYRRWRQRHRASAAGSDEHALLLAAAQRHLTQRLADGGLIGLYWPLAGEIDLRPLADAGLPLALPAVEPAGVVPERMVYRPWSPGDPLLPDGCGIPAPLPGCGNLFPSDLGVLLVPALAFDPVSGIRLGQGGGWYDRLRADPAWAAVPALVVIPADCLHRGLPQEPWDVPFSGWLDAGGIHGLESL